MKFPKNRAHIFIVVREDIPSNRTAILGTFSQLDEADDFRTVCLSEWLEKGFAVTDALFEVRISTYYG